METNNQSVTTTAGASLTIYDPEAMSRRLAHIRSVEAALGVREQFPTLGALRREYGDYKAEAVVKLYLVDLSDLVNLKHPLSEKQIDRIAMEVVARYNTLTTADLHVIFSKAIAGDYGDFYESLDVVKVLKWFSNYFKERCATAAEMSQREAERLYDKGGNMTSERMAQQFNDLAKKLNFK